MFFGRILIPPAVVDEIMKTTAGDRILALDFLEIQTPTDTDRVGDLRRSLDPGESEALALALEIEATSILMDEMAGRIEAERLGLVPIGALGILKLARRADLVGPLAPLIDRLRSELKFFVSDTIRAKVLREVGE